MGWNAEKKNLLAQAYHETSPAESAQMELLATAIVEMAVLTGLIDGARPMTGPQVLHVAADVKEFLKRQKAGAQEIHATSQK